jgi:soluble lytic murein transglycosylase
LPQAINPRTDIISVRRIQNGREIGLFARWNKLREQLHMTLSNFHSLTAAKVLAPLCAVFIWGILSTSAHAQNAKLFPSPAILPTIKPAPDSQTDDLVPIAKTTILPKDRTLFVRAMQQVKRRRWRSARTIAAEAESQLPRKIVDWIYMRQPGANVSFLERAAFISANPSWPLIAELRRRAEDAIDRDVPATALTAWFAAQPPSTASGVLAYARALRAGGNAIRAAEVIRRAWVEGLSGRNQERAILKEFGESLSAENHWERIDRLLYIGYATTAERALKFVDRDHQLLARARIALVRSRSGVDAAIARVPAQLQNDPGLLYDRVKWRRQRGRENEARELIPEFPLGGPRPDLWWRERRILARDALTSGNPSEAYKLAKYHGATDALSVSEAEWLAGWIALRYLKDGEAALPHFEKVYDSVLMPVSLSRGAYWTGRAAEFLGRADIAEEWYLRAGAYPTTYYGQLGIARLKEGAIPQLPQDPIPTQDERDAFESNELTQAVKLLLLTDEKVYQRHFAQALAASTGFGSIRHLTVEMTSRLARPDIGVWVSRRAAADKITLLKYGYPAPFYDYPSAPEKALILAISRQESNFDPTARSHAGARGLMQLMPATARNVSRAARVRYTRDRLTSDPAYNLKIGSRYLASLVRSFDGSYVLAAAAYNAGPNRARRWIRRYGDPRQPDTDAIDWIENIPFSETRNYVQRVMENLIVYRAILAGVYNVPQTLEAELVNSR